MGPDRPLTEQLRFARSTEFTWETHGPRDIHAHLTSPIIGLLDRRGVRSVLDLGCGNGWFSSALDRCGFDVTGVDHSESGIAIARREHPDVRFQRHDVMLPLEAELIGRFDAVVSIELIDHLPFPRRLIESALSALKPGGLLIVATPFHGYVKNLALALTNRFDERWHPLRDHGRVKFFSRHTLTALLTEYELDDIRLETVGRVPMFARAMVISGRAPS
jgi:2-polyprenyl-3-methyl-5-hydroxy-6-metoxy-1,4-benzoquinol methylase